MTEEQNNQLHESAKEYLVSLTPADASASESDVYGFAKWCPCALIDLQAADIDDYVECQSMSDSKYSERMKHVRAFLDYAYKQKLITLKLSAHLKPRKTKIRSGGNGAKQSAPVNMTLEGYDKLKTELVALKEQRDEAIHEIQKAAADKDFRENAPLEAARENHGIVMGRIREIEELLKCAVISDSKLDSGQRVNVHNTVILVDAAGKEYRYTIVNPHEVKPSQGLISNASPIGKAVLGKEQGKEVEVVTPGGKFKYKIKEVVR